MKIQPSTTHMITSNCIPSKVRSPIFSYPLIACKCDSIGDQLYDWYVKRFLTISRSLLLFLSLLTCRFDLVRTDPDRDHTYYDLTKDADHVLSGYRRCGRNSFSRVKHYPPNPTSSIRARRRALEKRIERNKSIFNSTSSHCSNGSSRRNRARRFTGASAASYSSSDSLGE